MKNRRTRRAETFHRKGAAPTTVTGHRVLGAFVPFAAANATTSDGWKVLAYEVAMAESNVALTRADFEQCVANFASYPCSPVTIEHADLFGGPREWREPNGHIEELRVGTMTRGGKEVATLEGRPSYLEPTATDMANRKWRYGSVTIIQGATSEETGAKLGSMLWSWSLTAHPRLTGLPALAASRRAPEGVVVAGYWYGDIDDREDLVSCLREIFDLPVTTTEDEILAELAKLEALAGGEGDTSGIDVDRLVGQLRDALRLPALTTTAKVLAEVRKGLDTLPSEADGAEDDATPLSLRGAAAPPHVPTEKPTMKFTLLLAALGLPAATSEEDAEKKVSAAAQLGLDALKALGLSPAATPTQVAEKVNGLTTAAAKVPVLEQELVTFRKEKTDAEKVLRASWIDDMLAVRPELAIVRASLERDAERDWAAFQATYPRPSREDVVTAAAEAAQRAQDPARMQPVTVAAHSASPRTKDAPKPSDPQTPAQVALSIQKVYEAQGFTLSIDDALGLAQQGETPESCRAFLAAQAPAAG